MITASNVRSLSVLVTALALAGCTNRPTAEPIQVGHVTPLSGPGRTVGEAARQGIQLAVEKANAAEGLIAGRKVEVRHADIGNGAETIANEAIRLITVNRVNALLGGTDAAGAGHLARAAQPYGVPVVTAGPLLTETGVENVFSVALSPTQQGKALARYVAEELKAARVAVLTDARCPGCGILARTFAKEFPEGQQRVRQWTYSEDAEFEELVKAVAQEKPDAVLIAGSARAFLRLRSRLQELGLQVPFAFGGEQLEAAALLEEPVDEGPIYLATPFAAEADVPAVREFVKEYHDRFGRAPDLHAALAYESARLLFEAIRQARSTEPARIRKALQEISTFEGLAGTLTFERGQVARRPVFIVRVADGDQTVQRYEPSK